MQIIKTHEIDITTISNWEKSQVYNGLDVCVTQDVFANLHPQLDKYTGRIYDFSKSLQGPVLEMGIRGVLVDQKRKEEVIDEYYEIMDRLEGQLNRIVLDGVGLMSFNWRSTADLRKIFYEVFGLSPVYRQGRPTVDRAAREALEVYPIAEQIIKHINILVELGDKISVLKTAIDVDGRIRTSYNIAGSSTGRFSSSASVFETGGNLQNIEESLRSIFIADPGMKFAKVDAKSGESFMVGAIEWNLFGDDKYLAACETGDPHTAVTKLCWPRLPWVGSIEADKVIAERPYYRHYTYRFMCKKLGHGSNYGGQPGTLAVEAKVPLRLVQQFQPLYFEAFPAHKRWQAWVEEQIRAKGYLVSLMGRKRYFFKRRNDPKTIREAIAFDPQGSLADVVNGAMLKIWQRGTALVMMQDHDALTFMYPQDREVEVVSMLQRQLVMPLRLANERMLKVPYDIQVGWNKGHASPGNPDGLVDWTGSDERKRSLSNLQ
ncbi:MAG: DNA polymerase [Nitrososphaerales archaeon]